MERIACSETTGDIRDCMKIISSIVSFVLLLLFLSPINIVIQPSPVSCIM